MSAGQRGSTLPKLSYKAVRAKSGLTVKMSYTFIKPPLLNQPECTVHRNKRRKLFNAGDVYVVLQK